MEYNKQTQITIVGVSQDHDKYGFKIFKDLLENGYSVIGVNPKGGTILQQPVYRSLDELPNVPELIIIVVPPTIGMTILQEAKKLGITNVWLQPGAQSNELIALAKKLKLNLIHDKCFMTTQGIW